MSAHSRHPGGSTPAAGSGVVPQRLGRLQLLTWTAIRDAVDHGMTAHEVSLATGFDRHSIQPRISELRRKGLVIASTKRRPNPSGKSATVWIAAEYADVAPSPS